MIILKTISVVSLVILITMIIPAAGNTAINSRGPTGFAVLPQAPSTENTQQVPPLDNVSGQVFDSLGRPAQAQIIFRNQTAEQDHAGSIFPGRVYFPPPPLITDAQGYYHLHLDDGSWLGYACGSQTGYQPLFWEVSIFDNVITSYRELSHVSPIIEDISVPLSDTQNPSPSLDPGTEITLTGNWFGCSGKLLMEIDGRQAEITEFIIHQNKLLKFALPNLSDKGIPQIKFFGLVYISGNNRSNLVSWQIPQQAHPAWGEGAVATSVFGAAVATTPNTASTTSSEQERPLEEQKKETQVTPEKTLSTPPQKTYKK